MIDRTSFCIACLVQLIIVAVGASWAPAHGESPDYAPVTAQDPLIQKDHLEILLTPLTQDELALEAEAWMELVKEKVRQISNAEIAVKFKIEEIESAEDAAEALEDAQEAAEDLEQAEQTAFVDPDAAQAAEEARQALAEAGEEALEAAEAAAAITENEEVKAAAAEAEAQALEQAAEAAEEDPAAEAPVVPQTDIAEVVSEEILLDADARQESADAAQQVAEEQAEVKTVILDNLNLLREERTALVDRTRIVLKAFEEKGGDPATQALYLNAVSGIRLETDDLESLWTAIIGWLKSSEGGMRWIMNLGKFMAIVSGFYVLSLVAGRATKRILGMSDNMSTMSRNCVARTTRRIIFIIGLIVGLTALEINIGPVLALIGAAGFVVAFALQETLGNFASGIMILVYRPFDVGDSVEVGGVSGSVASLNLVSVTIKTFDNRVTIVPNNQVWGSVIVNSSISETRRIDLVFGIGSADDMATAQTIMEDLVRSHELILKDPEPTIRVSELAESSVNFICRPWVKRGDYSTVSSDLLRQVKERFDAEGISIPFPQRDLHIIQEMAEVGHE